MLLGVIIGLVAVVGKQTRKALLVTPRHKSSRKKWLTSQNRNSIDDPLRSALTPTARQAPPSPSIRLVQA
jgi:hypothetical protein